SLHLALDEREDVVRVLIGDQAAGDLGVGATGCYRLDPVALEPTPETVEVDGRPYPASLQHGVARFAPKRRGIKRCPECLVVERNGRDLRALRRRQLFDRVVEPRDRDASVGRVEGRDELDECLDGVRRRRAVLTGMEVAAAGLNVDLAGRKPLA